MNKRAFTIIELLTTVAIIAILAVISATLYPTVQERFATASTEQTMKLLVAGLEQYYDFWGEFPLIDKTASNEVIDENYKNTDLETDIDVTIDMSDGTPEEEFASIEGLYFCLNKTPTCRVFLSKIKAEFVTAENPIDKFLKVDDSDGKEYQLFRVNDDWKTVLRYMYDKDNDSFPVIESAGPDEEFGDVSGTAAEKALAEDNISSLDI